VTPGNAGDRDCSRNEKEENIMMDELISAVSTRTGLSQDQARSAVDAVVGLLKTKLPAPLASHLDSLVGGSASAAAGDGSDAETSGTESGELASAATALLGNLFDKKS
jgi:hypothetical protein